VERARLGALTAEMQQGLRPSRRSKMIFRRLLPMPERQKDNWMPRKKLSTPPVSLIRILKKDWRSER
jgi:hypothetical protein